jgi:hypothetical protein
MTKGLRTRLLMIGAISLVAVPAAAGLRMLGSAPSRRQVVAMPQAHTPLTAGWIAFATAPAMRHSEGGPSGSDIFLARPGGRPRLVASRSHNQIWNLCPAFSPRGTMLAFGRWAGENLTIRVVGVAADGSIGGPQITIAVPDINRVAPCPKWSADGSRLAYLNTRFRLIVRGLDGSRQQPAPGDPRLQDFRRYYPPAIAPAGDLVARTETENATCGIVISRPDGSSRRIVSDQPCGYAIAGWSPDGRYILLMRDVGGAFTMIAASVNPPFTSTAIAVDVPVNNERAWPQYGDVSWQPTVQSGAPPIPSPPATTPSVIATTREFASLATDPFPPLKAMSQPNGWRNGRWTSGPTARASRQPFKVGGCIADLREFGEAEFRSAHWVFGPSHIGIASEYVLRYHDAAGAVGGFADIRATFGRCLRVWPHRQARPTGIMVTDIKDLFDLGGPVDAAFVVGAWPLTLLPIGYPDGVVRDGNVVIVIEGDHAWPDGAPINLERALLWAIPSESRRCRWVDGFPGSAVCRPAP